MATLAWDPLGRELFECWHYEDLHPACPAAVENLFDDPFQDGPLYQDLEWTKALCVAEGQVSKSMAREYTQLSTFVAWEGDSHGLRALLHNRD